MPQIKKSGSGLWMVLLALGLLVTACAPQQKQSLSTEEPDVETLPLTIQPGEAEVTAFQKTLAEKVQENGEDVLAYLINDVKIDHIQYNTERTLALLWLALVDRETGEILPGEPGLAIAKREGPSAAWKVTLQSDGEWVAELQSVPDSMLDQATRDLYMPAVQQTPKDHPVYTGYKLPWEAGVARRVTGSIGHVFIYRSCPSTCLYAFDFADGTMWPILAAKGGRVKYAVWQYPNGNTSNTNYIVLEDNTTVPTTYQVYYHLAQDSIPPELRVPGAEVVQGQFIGIVDDTGYSTGHHLHFHVHTSTTTHWGTSVDISFDDVNDNGGRPRTCYEASNFPSYGTQCQTGNWYVSGNGDTERPTGGITQPAANTVYTQPELTVSGWAKDDSGITAVQVMANTTGDWYPIGPIITKSEFTTKINLCAENIPNGRFFISLQVLDESGKLSNGLPGLTQLEKQYTCPGQPPACAPGPNEVALYSEKSFTGSCHTFPIGDYLTSAQFGYLADNSASSIQVGTNVMARLFSDANLAGNSENILQNDSDLSDNKIGTDSISSLAVSIRPEIPAIPSLKIPSANITDASEIELTWGSAKSGVEFRSVLAGEQGWRQELNWQSSTSWAVGKLPAGKYTWTVWARNLSGESEAKLEFEVQPADPAPVTALKTLPAEWGSSAIHLEWSVQQGSEDLAYFDLQVQENGGAWSMLAEAINPQQRDFWMLGTPGTSYGFRLRGVDSAGNQEAFTDSAETLTRIMVDCTPDAYENNGSDNTWTGAARLEINQSQQHNFCTAQDVDWLSFEATAGQKYTIKVNPVDAGASAAVQIIAPDRYTVLMETSAEEMNQAITMEWTAPEDGQYYLMVRPFDERLTGSATQYAVAVESTTPVSPAVFTCSALFLPLVYGLLKLFQKTKQGASL